MPVAALDNRLWVLLGVVAYLCTTMSVGGGQDEEP